MIYIYIYIYSKRIKKGSDIKKGNWRKITEYLDKLQPRTEILSQSMGAYIYIYIYIYMYLGVGSLEGKMEIMQQHMSEVLREKMEINRLDQGNYGYDSSNPMNSPSNATSAYAFTNQIWVLIILNTIYILLINIHIHL